MLIGLLRPTAGSVEVDGSRRHPRPAPSARPHRVHGAEGQPLSGAVAARERRVLRRSLRPRRRRARRSAGARCASASSSVDVETERSEDLSAGVRQRAGLAVATLHRPRVLFLDEPTAGVDVHNRGRFWELIQEEAEAGVTVFVTTHFLEEAEYCDWVSLIDRG